MHRFYCLIGLHDWEAMYRGDDYNFRKCWVCRRWEQRIKQDGRVLWVYYVS